MNELLATPVRTVIECIESWHNEDYTLWYRLYSDNWCEQGGKFDDETYHGMHKVNLIKSYANTNYFITITRNLQYDAYVWGTHSNQVNTITQSSFIVGVSTGGFGNVMWKAEGYVA